MRHNKCVEKCPPNKDGSDEFYTCASECFEEDFLILNVIEKNIVEEVNSSFSKML